MPKKAAVLSCLGLGDALICCILANQLYRQGYEVTLFHPSIQSAQEWFPHIGFKTYKELDLSCYEAIFIFYEKSPWMQEAINQATTLYREKSVILNPIATPRTDYLYWENGEFDGRKPFVDNLVKYCQKKLHFVDASKETGISPLPFLTHKKYPSRVVIHPTSSKEEKNWGKGQFLELEKKLKKAGFSPVFVVSPKEKIAWPEAISFASLSALFAFVYESGWMIGNDSGIGHLASLLGLPTLILFRTKRGADFWRPAWEKGKVCTPFSWIPNIKYARWREKFWRQAIPCFYVWKQFLALTQEKGG